jgi:hypothetical protein
MKYLYKYPQSRFPYEQLVAENQARDRNVDEYEIMDTGVFDEDRYWDVFVEVSVFSSSCPSSQLTTFISTQRMKTTLIQYTSALRRTTEDLIQLHFTLFPSSGSLTLGLGQPKSRLCLPCLDQLARKSVLLLLVTRK